MQNIQEKWNKIKDKLPWNTAIMDVHVHPEKLKVEILEFNIFSPLASACLFDWEVDQDQLCGKTTRVEFRILKMWMPKKKVPIQRKYADDTRIKSRL